MDFHGTSLLNVKSEVFELTMRTEMWMQVENVVTKRSAEVTGPGQFDTSEFSKQVLFLFHEAMCN